jgi:hypothetical protein
LHTFILFNFSKFRRLIEANRDLVLPNQSTFEGNVDGHYYLIPGVPDPPDNRGNVYNKNKSKRIGMVGRKIGMTLQWFIFYFNLLNNIFANVRTFLG